MLKKNINLKVVNIDDLGKVFKPEDIVKGRRKVIEEALKDLGFVEVESVIKLLQSWRGSESEEELKRILGSDKAQYILKKLQI